MTSPPRALADDVLTICEYCFLEGPIARLDEHLYLDHPELFWASPKGHVKHEWYTVVIPGRFRYRLERIRKQSGRSVGQIIAGALDAQGLGQQKRPNPALPGGPGGGGGILEPPSVRSN